jgi:hypothetical protein
VTRELDAHLDYFTCWLPEQAGWLSLEEAEAAVLNQRSGGTKTTMVCCDLHCKPTPLG